MPDRPDPRSYLPLTPLAFQVMLALADTDRHGYGIIQEVRQRTDDLIRLGTGTLYTMLRRLLEDQLIDRSDDRMPARTRQSAGEEDDQRRKYYRLTPLGRAVLAAEVHRLQAALTEARDKRVMPIARSRSKH